MMEGYMGPILPGDSFGWKPFGADGWVVVGDVREADAACCEVRLMGRANWLSEAEFRRNAVASHDTLTPITPITSKVAMTLAERAEAYAHASGWRTKEDWEARVEAYKAGFYDGCEKEESDA